MEYRDVVSNRYRSDEAIDQLPRSFSSTSTDTIKRCRFFIVNGLRQQKCPARHESSQVIEMLIVTGTRQNLHPHRLANGDIATDQIVDTMTNRASRIAEEFDPSRCINQNHQTRAERISSSSPSQPLPRSARASSTSNGSAAINRRAKLTASRFVERWYLLMTTLQASSSISTLVRAIHQLYTLWGLLTYISRGCLVIGEPTLSTQPFAAQRLVVDHPSRRSSLYRRSAWSARLDDP